MYGTKQKKKYINTKMALLNRKFMNYAFHFLYCYSYRSKNSTYNKMYFTYISDSVDIHLFVTKKCNCYYYFYFPSGSFKY